MRRGEDAGWGFGADQVHRLGFLVGHRTQALQSLTEIWQLRKNAVKADACLFFVEWDLLLLSNILAQREGKTSTGDDSRGKSNTYTISRILPFQHLSFLPPPLFNLKLSHLPFTGSGELTWLTYQLAAWNEGQRWGGGGGWGQLSNTQISVVQKWFPSSEMSCNMWGLAFGLLWWKKKVGG